MDTPFKNKQQIAIVVAVVAIIIAAACAFVLLDNPDDENPVHEKAYDAAGIGMDDDYDYSKIVTVGVGTLRWVSYFGYEDKVVCIDAGDANNASWNGKGYRSLFDFNQAELVKKMTGGNATPSESDLKNYGMALHDHNGLSTGNLEALGGWTDKPTLMIVTDSIYEGFTEEMKKGINMLMDIVVVYEVDSFVDSDLTFSEEFNSNLRIFAQIFDDYFRADKLRSDIQDLFNDIKDITEGKTPKYSNAYIGGAALAGGKALTWTVGSYLPFQLAGIDNAYTANKDTTARDGGAEVLSKVDPEAIFMDLSGTSKFTNDESKPVTTYADLKDVPIYTLLPYYWFGYNFDNAIVNAYYLVYACYDNVLTYEKCVEKISNVYETFMPGAKDLKTTIGSEEYSGGAAVFYNMSDYYAKTGSQLFMDGNELRVTSTDSVIFTPAN